MSEENRSFYIALRVKDIPTPPLPSVRLVCSGGCGEEIWADKNTERIWSKVPVFCTECAAKLIESEGEEIDFVVAPETVESIEKFFKRLTDIYARRMEEFDLDFETVEKLFKHLVRAHKH